MAFSADEHSQQPINIPGPLSFHLGHGLRLTIAAEPCAACAQTQRSTTSIDDTSANESIITMDTWCDACGAQKKNRYRIRTQPGSWSAFDNDVAGRWQVQALLNLDRHEWHHDAGIDISRGPSPVRKGLSR